MKYLAVARAILVIAAALLVAAALAPLAVFRGELSGHASLLSYEVVFMGERVVVPKANTLITKALILLGYAVIVAAVAAWRGSPALVYAVYMNYVAFIPALASLKRSYLSSLVFKKTYNIVSGGKLVIDYSVTTYNYFETLLFGAAVLVVFGMVFTAAYMLTLNEGQAGETRGERAPSSIARIVRSRLIRGGRGLRGLRGVPPAARNRIVRWEMVRGKRFPPRARRIR